jgi:hypothetical protein
MGGRHMMSRTRVVSPIVVTVGFAAVAGGEGVAYAVLRGTPDGTESLVRVGFRCRPSTALHGRDVAYAALGAVASELLRRNVERIELRTQSAELGADLDERRNVPQSLIVPYVSLRCALNRFREARVRVSDERTIRDLTARALAEASLHIAA